VSLFSDEALAATRARYARRQAKQSAPTPPPPTLPPGFTYRERTPQEWNRRINQTLRSSFGVAVPEIEPLKTPRVKANAVTESTVCACGHTHGVHDTARPSYPALKETFALGDCSLITTPCKVNTGCDCWNFVSSETGKVQPLKRPKVQGHVLCKKCGHARQDHCTAHKATKIRKPGEWEGFKRDGQAAACQHTTDAVWYRCNSTSCAAGVGKEFCPCTKFVSPLTLPKVTKPRVASGKSRATVSQDATPAVVMTDSTSETIVVSLRKKRIKKTSFTTGENLFPPSTTTAPQTDK
jgi:hypothetical protein